MNLLEFFLNTGDKAKAEQSVSAPAFSFTKVMALMATIVAPVTTVIVDTSSKGVTLSMWQYVTLALGVLAFLALLGAADMFARAYATGQEARERIARNNVAHLLPFAKPISVHDKNHVDDHYKVVAAAEGAEPYMLVIPNGNGGHPTWMNPSDLIPD